MESFIDEMKRYVGLAEEDAILLRQLGPRMEKYLAGMAEEFYSHIPSHPGAFQVFTGGQEQIERLKQTLQQWARGLFCGVYDDRYAAQRYEIGKRHVRIGLEQKYVISAMATVRAYFAHCLLLEFPAGDVRLRYTRSLGKILDIDLNLMCESYMQATMENLRSLNEQLERANSELAEASRSKDEFLAHTSHELRTPLNSILGFTKLILDGLCSSKREEEELLRDVYASAQHLLGLVNDILDLGRMEAGKMTLHVEDVDPHTVFTSTLPLVMVQAAGKRLEIVDETAGRKLPPVRADVTRFRQVLLNLLTNAVKFTTHGSVTLRASENRTHLRIEVEDTGIGIPEDQRKGMFEKFYQANPVLARRHGGSGLGLAISRRLVEMMGGEIGLESEGANRGTLVWFTLPQAGASKATGKARR